MDAMPRPVSPHPVFAASGDVTRELLKVLRAREAKTASEMVARFVADFGSETGAVALATGLATGIAVGTGLWRDTPRVGGARVELADGDLPDSVPLFDADADGYAARRELARQFMQLFLNDDEDSSLRAIRRGKVDPTALLYGLCEMAATAW